MKTIGERIRKARENTNLKQTELAKLLNKSQGTITDIENGKNKGNFEILKEICIALNVSADWILFGSEKQEKENLSDEGKRLLQEYKKYLEQNYPNKKDYEKVGNL